MASDSRLTIRSALVALLLANLVTAEPLRFYARDDAAVAASGAGSTSAAASSGAVAVPANASSSSGGNGAAAPVSAQSDSSAQSGAASASSGSLQLCGSQYYSQDKVLTVTSCCPTR